MISFTLQLCIKHIKTKSTPPYTKTTDKMHTFLDSVLTHLAPDSLLPPALLPYRETPDRLVVGG